MKAKEFKDERVINKLKEVEDFLDLDEDKKRILEEYDFPDYEYYKYPQFSEAIEIFPEGKKCDCCGKESKLFYNYCAYGPVDDKYLCPECIKAGKFARENDMEIAIIDNDEYIEDLDQEMIEDKNKIDVLQKTTPPLPTANDMTWRTHCDDFAVYIGKLSYNDLKTLDVNCIKDIKEDLKNNKYFFEMSFRQLKKALKSEESDVEVHLFKCKHCNKYFIQVDLF